MVACAHDSYILQLLTTDYWKSRLSPDGGLTVSMNKVAESAIISSPAFWNDFGQGMYLLCSTLKLCLYFLLWPQHTSSAADPVRRFYSLPSTVTGCCWGKCWQSIAVIFTVFNGSDSSHCDCGLCHGGKLVFKFLALTHLFIMGASAIQLLCMCSKQILLGMLPKLQSCCSSDHSRWLHTVGIINSSCQVFCQSPLSVGSHCISLKVVQMEHPSISYTRLIQLRVAGELEPIPAVIRVRGRVHPGQVTSPSQGHKRNKQPSTLTLTPRVNLASPVNLTCMFLGDGKKPE